MFAFVFVIVYVGTSCTKDIPPYTARTIRFVLYTKKDFSDNNNSISFSIFIRSHRKILFDSSLAPITLKDIPAFSNKIIIEKKVPEDDGSDVAAGFHYTIGNIGNSRYTDTCKAGQRFKQISFAFK
jgi:hypothetical protein